jgi:hypothetical protein
VLANHKGKLYLWHLLIERARKIAATEIKEWPEAYQEARAEIAKMDIPPTWPVCPRCECKVSTSLTPQNKEFCSCWGQKRR